ncbi:Isoleucyl-tRNA synthetase [Coriobacterium glomerans PW2]|uniref:Isoleucine--tRNA ligase n=1 Tax=Coriobacterium glomerans (strain ATCC 49209 / DSM 20642 / JCM 10262 / PW2) TaxID=700015 RepID=F2N9M3_CORGP|nr:isoleucine--tRNA ligase [Coriobacterium glomerans]AEB07126.1 Isoleucyl-tRNA synthetase [Coriobacterium glomerans PW2]
MGNDYKHTMNLPKTGFPMRGSLAKTEPARLESWRSARVYRLAQQRCSEQESFVLHDGPPYANGPIHMGHAMNKIGKDMINRYWMMRGRQVHFVPGWDCHGQPIEHRVEEKLGTERFNRTPVERIRELCRRFAVENIEVQKAGFERLGVLADWDNPYLTLHHEHDAADIEVFKSLFDQGMIYRGHKPVHWCKHCHTALAEAEIEYGDETSPSVYVRFELTDTPKGLEGFSGPVDFIIWTTTPWTLPSDQAVSLKPGAIYTAIEHAGRAELMAEELAERVCEQLGWDLTPLEVDGRPYRVVAEDLFHLRYRQPIFDQVRGIALLADYVGLDEGTGIVHNSPGHGVDDYYACMAEDMEICMPVDDDGRFYSGESFGTGGPFSGLDTDEANPEIIEYLRERGTLVGEKRISHSYPHCWRCGNPVLFRATDQWFVSMDAANLRSRALEAIDTCVRWYPGNASNRLSAMIEGRPDWCISRQRNWGVPIPSYTCAACGEKVMTDETLDAVIELFRDRGSDAWFTETPESYLGAACACPACGSHRLKADKDILDVWWDSGVSWQAVLRKRPGLSYPADLYLEGSDQHRGWFQSSLLTSVAAEGTAPFRGVVSQGFVLDGQGRKMSKSLGNVIDPNAICEEMGADIVRLWVASVDTSSDVACDRDILARTSDAYRRFRNTFRFLLSELEGQFDPKTDAVDVAQLLPLDRLMLAKMTLVQAEVTGAYASYEFNRVYRTLYDFVVTELSNVYLDALKDRLYCERADAPARRSAQTVLSELLSMLLRDLQPILAYTTDEVMAFAPSGCRDDQTYAALLEWYETPLSLGEAESLSPVLEAALELRAAVTKTLEDGRADGEFTKSQEVRVRATVPAAMHELLTGADAPDLAEFFIVAEVELVAGEELAIEIAAAEGERCDRCWRYRESTGPHGEHARICDRCADAMGV